MLEKGIQSLGRMLICKCAAAIDSAAVGSPHFISTAEPILTKFCSLYAKGVCKYRLFCEDTCNETDIEPKILFVK